MAAIVEGELARGELIVLRTKTMADAQQDYEWRRDPELSTFDAARPYTGSFRDYLHIFNDELTYPSPYRRTVSVEDFNGVHIGNVMYYNMDYQRREAEVGITIGLREYWSRGYGTDLVRTFAKYMYETLPVDRIYLKTLDWNFRAQRCFEKAGFKRYGTSRRGEHNFILMDTVRRTFFSSDEDTETA